MRLKATKPRPAPCSPEADMPDPTPNTPRQKIWPIFALAAALMVFGGYFVFFADPAPVEPPAPMPEPFIVAAPAPSAAPLAEPVHLAYAEGAGRKFQLDLRQRRTVGSHAAATWIRTDVSESAAGDAELERHYADTEIATYAEGEAVGPDIAGEVEKLVNATVRRVHRDVTGAPLDVQTTTTHSSEQMRALLDLLDSAIDLLHLRVPREPVRAGEPWTWRTQEIELVARVTGRAQDGAVILGVEARPIPGADNETTGTGWARWDAARGGLVEAVLHLTRSETTGKVAATTNYALHLRVTHLE